MDFIYALGGRFMYDPMLDNSWKGRAFRFLVATIVWIIFYYNTDFRGWKLIGLICGCYIWGMFYTFVYRKVSKYTGKFFHPTE